MIQNVVVILNVSQLTFDISFYNAFSKQFKFHIIMKG